MSYTLPEAVTRWSSQIAKASAEFGVPASLIAGVMMQECPSGNPSEIGGVGEVGLMQIRPETARDVGITNLYDPLDNIRCGTKYLKQLLNKYNGNVTAALTAYNSGMGTVAKYGVDYLVNKYGYATKVLRYADNQLNNLNTSNVTDVVGTAARSSGSTLESSGSNETIQVFVAESEKNIKRWGILQYFEQIDTPSLGQNKADALLKIYNRKTRSLTIRDAFGNPEVRGGSMIPVQLDLGDYIANSYFIVDKVVHKFSKDSHTMDVTVEGAYDE